MLISVGVLQSKLFKKGLTPAQAARIRLQIEALNIQIQELRKKQINRPCP